MEKAEPKKKGIKTIHLAIKGVNALGTVLMYVNADKHKAEFEEKPYGIMVTFPKDAHHPTTKHLIPYANIPSIDYYVD